MKMMPKALILAAFALVAGVWGWGYYSHDEAPTSKHRLGHDRPVEDLVGALDRLRSAVPKQNRTRLVN